MGTFGSAIIWLTSPPNDVLACPGKVFAVVGSTVFRRFAANPLNNIVNLWIKHRRVWIEEVEDIKSTSRSVIWIQDDCSVAESVPIFL